MLNQFGISGKLFLDNKYSFSLYLYVTIEQL